MVIKNRTSIHELNLRSREIFRHIVDTYLETGEPIGSKVISKRANLNLSPATIRNVMADLEEAGLLFAPHISAGRVPTELGLRLFVDGLLEIGYLGEDERRNMEEKCQVGGHNFPIMLEQAIQALSGLSRCAGLVVAPTTEYRLKHMEFLKLGPDRALVVMVSEDGLIENRLIDLPKGLPPAALVEAGNYLTARLINKTLAEATVEITKELDDHRTELNFLTEKVIKTGLATWAGTKNERILILSGQSHLLEEVKELEDLERVRILFQMLENKESMVRLLEESKKAKHVQIFIGSQNELFNLTGCSLIIAPYQNNRQQVIGAVGVIGPSRIDYARIIPMVNYTAQLIGRFLTKK